MWLATEDVKRALTAVIAKYEAESVVPSEEELKGEYEALVAARDVLIAKEISNADLLNFDSAHVVGDSVAARVTLPITPEIAAAHEEVKALAAKARDRERLAIRAGSRARVLVRLRGYQTMVNSSRKDAINVPKDVYPLIEDVLIKE